MKQIITPIKQNDQLVKPKLEDINYFDNNYIIENTMNNIVKTRYLINENLMNWIMFDIGCIRRYLLCYNKVYKQNEERKNSNALKLKKLSILNNI